MRLLDTATLRLEDFHGIPEEPYAILSHKWGTEEITYKDLKGYHKMQKQFSRYKPYKRAVGRVNQEVFSSRRRYSAGSEAGLGFAKSLQASARERFPIGLG